MYLVYLAMGLVGVVGLTGLGGALSDGVIGYAPFWAMERPYSLGGRDGLLVVLGVDFVYSLCRNILHISNILNAKQHKCLFYRV